MCVAGKAKYPKFRLKNVNKKSTIHNVYRCKSTKLKEYNFPSDCGVTLDLWHDNGGDVGSIFTAPAPSK